MNRYSQYTPSQFNPLTRDEIFTVPLAKQAQHDKAQASLDELGLFDINRLNVDDELATGYINDFTNQINQEIDTISKSGINNQSIGKIKSLARERDKWLKQGDGRQIEANYNAYVANKAELQKAYEKGDISADKYNLGLQQALNDYKGVAEGGSFNPFVAAKDTDYNKIALDAAKAVPIQERHEFLLKNGYQLSEDGSTYFHGDTNRKFTKEGAIASIVANQLTTNDKVISDLRQQEKLGLLGEGVTAQDKILSIALNLEKNLSVNSIDKDLKISGNKGFNNNTANSSKAFGNSNVYSHNSYTNPIFGESADHKDIVSNYTKLIESGEVTTGNKIKAHYQRASDKFKEIYPEVVDNYNNLNYTAEGKIAQRFDKLNVEDIINLDTVVNSTFAGGKPYVVPNEDGTYSITKNIHDGTRSNSYKGTEVIGTLTADEYLSLIHI